MNPMQLFNMYLIYKHIITSYIYYSLQPYKTLDKTIQNISVAPEEISKPLCWGSFLMKQFHKLKKKVQIIKF